jgi:8-oxo-dGTP pyrophosphatase MutT (NUDIX family)
MISTVEPPRHSVSVVAVIVDDEQRVLVAQRRDTGDLRVF